MHDFAREQEEQSPTRTWTSKIDVGRKAWCVMNVRFLDVTNCQLTNVSHLADILSLYVELIVLTP